ncbi:oligosaccharide flippase family protein [Mannheimia sp. E30BD]
MSEKVIYLFGLIFVTALVAKYIGPENFGKLAFVTSIFAIVQTVCMFGLENVIFQKISKNRKMGERVMFASATIRNVLFFAISPILLLYLYFTSDYLTFIFSFSTCIATYFSLNDVYNIYFNATLNSKINMLCNSIGLIVSLLARYLVPYLNLEYHWLSISIILMTFFPYILRRIIYANTNGAKRSGGVKHRNYMINVGKHLILYSLSITLYTQVVQLLLGYYSKYKLGIFSVAYTLGNSFYFILAALISSFMIKVYSEEEGEQTKILVAKLNWIVIGVSILAFLFLYCFGELIIVLLYGEQYKEASDIIIFIIISCCFSGLATISEKYLFKFNEYDYLNKKTIRLCILNFILSFVMIKIYGIYGAVLSVLLLQMISATIYNYLFRFKEGLILETHKAMFKLLKR